MAPAGIFVPPDSPVREPADLAQVPISVGWQSAPPPFSPPQAGEGQGGGQALDAYLPPAKINLSFKDGLLFRRMELLIDRQVPAAALFSGPYYY